MGKIARLRHWKNSKLSLSLVSDIFTQISPNPGKAALRGSLLELCFRPEDDMNER
jgi:hypothetical protein